MLGRFFLFSLLHLCAGVTGWWLDAHRGALVGVVLAALATMGLDMLLAARVNAWLRKGDLRQPPLKVGLWGEVSERMVRASRRLEKQHQGSEQRLSDFLAAIQASPSGVVLLDGKGAIEWFNQTAASHFGMDAQRDQQQLIGNLVRDPGFAAYWGGGDFSRDMLIPGRSDSPSRPVRLSVQIHPYADGEGKGKRLLLSRDVTALEQAEAMRRDFVANVSHEIRTPLTVLAGFVETLQNLPLSDAQRTRYLDLMAVQSQRMQTLVADLLTLSSLEGRPTPSFKEWTALPQLYEAYLQEAQAVSASVGGARGVAHVLALHVPPPMALAGAEGELISALTNLVNNAVRYTPPGGRIEASWAVLSDGCLEFSVTDTGPGIAPEHLPRLTERFYRVDRSRSRETGGTGLGLAIVKHVAQRHGAELRIDSTLGVGSRFALRFPKPRWREGSQDCL